MVHPNHDGSWLTVRRLRAHGLILFLCLWSVYTWNMATPGLRDRGGNLKGADFIHLYTLGSVALEHRVADLYDMNAQAELTAQRVPAAAGIRYVPLYPPQVSVFFALLAALPYGGVLIAWLVFSAAVYGLCCYAFWRACPNLSGDGWTVFLLAAAFPGFFHLILWGQASALALACFTMAFISLRKERALIAGLALGCLIFKPQLGLAAAVVFAFARAWEVLAGGVLSAVSQLAVAWFYYGVGSLQQWMRVLLRVTYTMPTLEPKPYQTHSLPTFWTMLVPRLDLAFGLYLLSACLVLWMTISTWRDRRSNLCLRYSSMLLATVLIAPHLTVYDLVILAPAFLLLADWLVSRPSSTGTRGLGALLYFAYLSPLLGPLARWTHLQLSVLAMTAVVYLIWHAVRRIDPLSKTESALI
jgi:alpha-1,2-mannosyltransferase